MVLVDTSVWIGHFRKADQRLAGMLNRAFVLTHPFVLGELACGSMKNRAAILTDLGALPAAVPATPDETLQLIDHRQLWGKGIGWIEAHLLASALLTDCEFWTLDERLKRVAAELGVKRPR